MLDVAQTPLCDVITRVSASAVEEYAQLEQQQNGQRCTEQRCDYMERGGLSLQSCYVEPAGDASRVGREQGRWSMQVVLAQSCGRQ